MLAKEQYIGAAALFGIALASWLFVVLSSPANHLSPDDRTYAQMDSLRRDSIARVKAQRDSLREARWEHVKDSFHILDSIRFATWAAERQLRYDSFRVADSLWRDSVGWYMAKREKKDTVLNLNTTDTAELTLIYGIGPYKAKRIIAYREQLGGFYSPEQLTDEALRDLRLDTLLRHFVAAPDSLRTIDVNHSGVTALARHPYLRYGQAKAIYQLRRKSVSLKTIDDLQPLSELDSADLARLRYYLCFE